MKFLLLLALGVVAAMADDDQLLKEFTDGNIQFTANVYKEMLKNNSGNFIVSPLSVEVPLSLIHAGATSVTAKQLSASLHLPESDEKIQEIFTKLAPSFQSNEKYNLSSINKIYVKEGFKISDQFKSTAVNVFRSEVQNICFVTPKAAAAEINKWIKEKTNNNIKDLVNFKDFDNKTRIVLINAMYFKGAWVKQFNEFITQKKPFHVTKDNKVDVDMMGITDYFNYYESPELNVKFLEMFYEGDDVSMTFVLPNEIDGLGALEEAHIAEVLAKPQFKKERVHVQIPKFKIESTIQFKPILQALGVVDAFEDYADFYGFGAEKQPLKISKVVQKAFIEVEEKGTTAAAATNALVSLVRTAYLFDSDPYEFEANHPFIFVLKHKISGIIFLGRHSQ